MEKSFLQLCAEGLEDLDNIDNYIQRWHYGNFNSTLHEYLGFYDEKAYGQWMLNPDILEKLISNIQKGG